MPNLICVYKVRRRICAGAQPCQLARGAVSVAPSAPRGRIRSHGDLGPFTNRTFAAPSVRLTGCHYPADIQAAEAKVAAAQYAQDPAQRDMGGVSMAGSSAAGSRMHTPAPSTCVGPASFCTTYFGS